MTNVELLLPTRQAVLFYVLSRFKFDQFIEMRKPEEQQVILLNQKIINKNL